MLPVIFHNSVINRKLPLHISCVTCNFHDGGINRSNVHVMIISQSYLSALAAVVHPASSHYCRHIMSRILWYWGFFLQIYRSRCLRTGNFSVFVLQNHGVTMSHSTPSGNGCSLEDCYTNLFSLVSWKPFFRRRPSILFKFKEIMLIKTCIIKLTYVDDVNSHVLKMKVIQVFVVAR